MKHGKKISLETFFFAVYLSGFLVMAVVLLIFQPHVDTVSGSPVSPPDEYFRMLIPKFICEHGKLPTGLEEEVRITGCGFSYGLYNTLPYIIQGWLMRFVSLFTDSELALLYAARSVNVVFGCCMAVVVYLLGKRLFSDSRFRWLFCVAVMYLPENLFVHSYVNTDSCCLLASAMILYALVWGYQEGFGFKNCVCLATGIVLCALSYYNAYGYILCSIFLFAAYYIVRENGKWRLDWKKMLAWGGLISLLVIIGAGWWYVRAFFVLDGDILGLQTKKELALLYAFDVTSPLNTYQARGVSISQMLAENNFFQCLYDSFIAAFGSLSITGVYWTYFSYKLFFGAGILGGLWGLGCFLAKAFLPGKAGGSEDKNTKNKKRADSAGGKNKKTESHWKRLFFHINMLLCMLLPLVIMIRYAYTMDYQHQGRYMLPALVPLMYYTVRGIQRLAGIVAFGKRLPVWLVNAGVAFAFFIAAGSAFYMTFVRALPVYMEVGMWLSY